MSLQFVPSRDHPQASQPLSRHTTSGITVTLDRLPTTPRPPNTLRLLYQNCNGVSNTRFELASLFTQASTLEPSIIGITETNLDWNQHHKATKPFLQSVKSKWPTNNTITACADETQQSPTAYQPGGCAQLALNNIVPRHQHKGKDHTGMGRWTVQHFKGTNNRGLVVYTVYRVSQNSPNGLGMKTAYLQQLRVLNRAGIIGAQPKEQILIDLAPEITSNTANGNEIIVMIDANSDLSDRDLCHFLACTNLVDLFHHEDLQLPTRSPGTKRIDFIFGTPRVADATRAVGYLPWNVPFTSDHLGLYLDLAEDHLLGSSLLDPARPSTRRLRSTAPRRCNLYLTTLDKHCRANNILNRITKLYNKCKNSRFLSASDRRAFQNIDTELTGYMLSAEHHCCHGQTTYQFSDVLALAGSKIRLLRKTIRQITAELQASRINGAPTPHLQEELKLTKAAYSAAWHDLRHAQNADHTHRRSMLTMLEQRAVANQLEDVSAILKSIKSAEDTNNAYAKIGPSLNPKNVSQLNRLLIPQDDGSTAEITDSNAIFDHLLHRGLHDFSQSEGTPLTHPDIKPHLPNHTWSQEWEDLVNGRYPTTLPETITDDVKTVLRALQSPSPATTDVNIYVSDDDLLSAFRTCNESTSSSPSGRHYGHYRTLGHSPPEFHHLIQIHRHIINFAIQHDCPPHRWCRALQIWIEKKPGFPKLDRLRIIQLLEADFNLVLKIIWGRRMVWQAEDNRVLDNIPQYGSRPNKTPHSALYLKVLSYDYIRYTRTTSAVFNNDAKGCYDRIIPSFGMAACRRVGLPTKAINLFLTTLRQMQFWVRSAYGISSGFYGNHDSANLPPPPHTGQTITALHGNIHGMMQGSSSAPAVWLLVHLVIFSALSLAAPGFTASCSRTSNTSKRKGEGFVDDTDLWVTSSADVSDENVLPSLQHLARLWHTYLVISGGALGINKCFYYSIAWRWAKSGSATMVDTLQPTSDITLLDSTTQEPIQITQVKPSSGLRTLGVRLAPDGNFRDEFVYRLSQAQEVVKNLKKVRFTRFEASIAYERVWWPKMSYPLAVTNFTKMQCQKLQSKFDNSFLGPLGINRKMPKAVLHGPSALGGLHFKHIHTEQGCLHAALLLYHLRHPPSEQCRQMTDIMLSHTAVESGVSNKVLSANAPINHLTQYMQPSFIFTTWIYLHNHGSSVTSPAIPTIPHQRTNDKFIMDLFCAANIRGRTLRKLQRCRLYLRILRLSDISSACGTFVRPSLRRGTRPAHYRPTYNFPRQIRPPRGDFQLFWATLVSTGAIHEDGTLCHPLGPWLQVDSLWRHYYSSEAKALYDVHPHPTDPSTYQIDKRMQLEYDTTNPTTTMFHRTATPATSLPIDSTPADITEFGHLLRSRSHPRVIPPSPPPTTADEIVARRTFLASYLQSTVELLNLSVTIATSFHVYQGTAHWTITNSTDDLPLFEQTMTYALSPDHGHDQTRLSLWTAYDCLSSIPHTHLDDIGTIHVTHSSVALTQIINRPGHNPHPLIPHHDIITNLIRITKRLHPQMTHHYIKPTKNRPPPPEDDPDEIPEGPLPLLPDIPDTHNLLLHDMIVGGRPAQALRQQHGRHHLLHRYYDKYDWCDTTIRTIHWRAHSLALSRFDPTDTLRIQKYIHGWLPTNAQKHNYGASNTSTCSVCHQEDTQLHVFQCPCPKMHQLRNDLLTNINRYMTKTKSSLALTSALKSGIRHWLRLHATHPTTRDHQNFPQWMPNPYNTGTATPEVIQLVSQAYKSQTNIGWQHLLQGRLSQDWSRAYCILHNTKFPSLRGDTWARKLITTIWRNFLTLWAQRCTSNGELLQDLQEIDGIAQRDHIEEQIRDAYSRGRYITHPEDHDYLFHTPVESLLTRNYTALQLWLKTYKSAQTKWQEHLDGRITNPIDRGPVQTTLHAFFPRTNTDTIPQPQP